MLIETGYWEEEEEAISPFIGLDSVQPVSVNNNCGIVISSIVYCQTKKASRIQFELLLSPVLFAHVFDKGTVSVFLKILSSCARLKSRESWVVPQCHMCIKLSLVRSSVLYAFQTFWNVFFKSPTLVDCAERGGDVEGSSSSSYSRGENSFQRALY